MRDAARPWIAGMALLVGTGVLLLGWGRVVTVAAETTPAPGKSPTIFETAGLRVGVCSYIGTNAVDRGIACVLNRRVIAHVLSYDEGVTTRTRQALRDAGVYGLVSVETRGDLSKLPYATRLLNLVVIEHLDAATVRGLTLREVLRVTVPHGVVLIGGATLEEVKSLLSKQQVEGAVRDVVEANGWVRLVTARPDWMGEWTHGLKHDAGRRGLAEDRLDPDGPGMGHMWVQWLGAQHRPPDHGSMSSHISLNGRYVSLSNAETPVWVRDGFYWRSLAGRSRQYVLSVRDAFNGMLHWTRPWRGSGPAGTKGGRMHKSRQLAGMGDIIYTIEQLDAMSIDPKTGRISSKPVLTGTDLRDGTIRFEVPLLESMTAKDDLLCDAGVVVVYRPGEAVYAFDGLTGGKKWSRIGPMRQAIADAGHLYVAFDGKNERVAALALESGKNAWTKSASGLGCGAGGLALSSAGGGRVVIVADKSRVLVLAGPDGKIEHTLDAAAIAPGSARSVGKYILAQGGTGTMLFDRATGKPARRATRTPKAVGGWACAQGSLSEEMFLAALSPRKSGPAHEFIGNQGVNISCYVGPVFANGLVYQPQQYCGCGEGGKTTGLLATSTVVPVPSREAFLEPGPLESGPAYGRAGEAGKPAQGWPTYRADAERSCSADCVMPATPRILWTRHLSRRPAQSPVVAAAWRGQHFCNLTISAPVVALGKVFVSLVDEHAIVALASGTGKQAWRFTANGRIDSPPTIHDGLCLFGSRDGWVYALNADAGTMVWRRRITPVDERISVYGQLESRFPVIGSVLVENGKAYATAGLSGQLGITLWEFEPGTGKNLAYRQLPRTSYLNDVLIKAGDGGLFINHRRVGEIDAASGTKRLWPPAGSSLRSGHSGILNTIRTLSPLCTARGFMDLGGLTAGTWAWNGERAFGFCLRKSRKPFLVVGTPGSGEGVADISAPALFGLDAGKAEGTKGPAMLWKADVKPVWAMAVGGDRLVVAGPDPAMCGALVQQTARKPSPRRPSFQDMLKGRKPAPARSTSEQNRVPIEKFPPSRDPRWEPKRIQGLWEPHRRDPLSIPGRFYVVNAADGAVTAGVQLPVTAVQDGIALADGCAYVSLADGSVVCLGAVQQE